MGLMHGTQLRNGGFRANTNIVLGNGEEDMDIDENNTTRTNNPAPFAATAHCPAPITTVQAQGGQLAPAPVLAAAADASVAVHMDVINQLVQGGHLHMNDQLHVPLEKFLTPFVEQEADATGHYAVMTVSWASLAWHGDGEREANVLVAGM